MKKIIHHLRRQPEEVKRHILHVVMVIATVILLLLWFYSLGKTLTDSSTQAKVKNDLQPLSALKGNLIDGYNSISQPDLKE